MNKKTIIFDFDGTIANTLDAGITIYNRIAHQFQCKPVNDEDREKITSKNVQQFLKEYGVSAIKLPFVVMRLQKELHSQIANIMPFEGITEEIKKIKEAGYHLGIMTSNSKKNVEAFLTIHELLHCFDFIYSCKNIFGKAHVIKKLLQEQNIDKESALYIGDETRDIEAAKKVGIPILAVSWGYNTKELLAPLNPYHIIDYPGEILSFLENQETPIK